MYLGDLNVDFICTRSKSHECGKYHVQSEIGVLKSLLFEI